MKGKKTKRTFKVKVTRFFQNGSVQDIIPWVAVGIALYFFCNSYN